MNLDITQPADTQKTVQPTTSSLYHGLGHGGDDALLDDDPGLGGVLEGLLGGPLTAHGQPERALVLLPGLERMRQLRGEELVVLR